MNSTKILQWNCRALQNKINEIKNFVSNYDADVICLSETRLNSTNTNKIKLNNYKLIEVNRPALGGGVAIFVKKESFKKIIVVPQTSIEIAGCELQKPGFEPIAVYSVYIPPSINISSLQFSNLFNRIKQISSIPTVVCGDFNAHNTAWGGAKDCTRGSRLYDIANENGFIFLNDGSPTYFHSKGMSSIDLTLATTEIAVNSTWKALNDTFGSDHCPIVIEAQLSARRIPQNQPKKCFIPKNTNLLEFHNKIQDEIRKHPQVTGSTVEKYEHLVNMLKKWSVVECNERNNVNAKPIWWNMDCDRAIAKRRRKLSIFKKSPNRTNFELLKQQEKETKKILNETKRASWKKYCETLTGETNISDVWKTVKKFRNSSTSEKNALDTELLTKFLERVAGPEIVTGDCPNSLIGPLTQEAEFLSSPIDEDELELALVTAKDTTPGPDLITYKLINALPKEAKTQLLNLFNEFFFSGVIPTDWKKFEIVPILKPNKDPQQVSSYRPIAMGSCIRKTFEKIIKTRIEWFLEAQDLMSPNQYGFRKNKSTADSCLELHTTINRNFEVGKNTYVAFLDVKGAFDNVNIDILGTKIRELGMPKPIIQIIYSLFSDRQIKIKNQTDGQYRSCRIGVPQGSTLAPLMFNIYVNDVGENIPRNTKILQYADDLAVVSEIVSEEVCRIELQYAVDAVIENLTKIGLEISTEKSCVVPFKNHKRKKPKPGFPILIGNEEIEYKYHVTFLGFTFNYNLCGTLHILRIHKKCKQLLNLLRCLAGVWWGSHPTVLLTIYKGLIRPILDYQSYLYDDSPESELVKLDRIQWAAIRTSIGAMRSTHTKSLEVEANIMPLRLRRQLMCDKIISKTMSQSTSRTNSILQQSHTIDSPKINVITTSLNKLRSLPVAICEKNPQFLYPFSSGLIKPKCIFPPISKNRCSDRDSKEIFNEYLMRFNDACKIYTDGSKMDGKVSAAIWIPSYDIEGVFELNPLASIFSAEIKAIVEALEFCTILDDQKFIVVSDSKSVLLAIQNPTARGTCVEISQIRSIIQYIESQAKTISFIWVPSHVGVAGNEYVDHLAKSAENSTNETEHPVCYRDLFEMFNRHAKEQWQNSWNDSEMGRYFYNINPKICTKPWFYDCLLNRGSITMITRLRLNHNLTGYHLHRINIIDSPSCECGAAIDSVDHILFECPLTESTLRNDFRHTMASKFNITELKILNILKNGHQLTYSELAKYIAKAKFKF